jgi:ABC-type lipoprotein export system ATPase subunit
MTLDHETDATAQSDRAVLVARGVVKSYQRGSEIVHALRDVTLSLFPGEVVILIGPSGSGKTTLLNVLCGWESPEVGTIEWLAGSEPAQTGSLPWSELALIPQRLGLIEEFTVRENVALPLRLTHRAEGAELDGLLQELGLDELADRVPSETSLGEQQRTALARALVLSPRLVLADEPTGHQDEGWARVVLRTLGVAARRGTSSLIATHNEEALAFADRGMAIRDGVLQEAPLDKGEPSLLS